MRPRGQPVAVATIILAVGAGFAVTGAGVNWGPFSFLHSWIKSGR